MSIGGAVQGQWMLLRQPVSQTLWAVDKEIEREMTVLHVLWDLRGGGAARLVPDLWR